MFRKRTKDNIVVSYKLRKRCLPAILLTALAKSAAMSFNIFARDYSYRKLYRDVADFHDALENAAFKRISPATFCSTLSRLQRQGLVRREGKRGQSLWHITQEGKKLIDALKGAYDFSSLPDQDGIMRLVIFDIPERERRKRDSLRVGLAACAYEPLQKSVWVGVRPLPKHFLSFLDDLDLAGKVHIFSVQEKGTIEDVVDEKEA